MSFFARLTERQAERIDDYIYDEITLYPKHELINGPLYAEDGKLPLFFDYNELRKKGEEICGKSSENDPLLTQFYFEVVNKIQTQKKEDLISLWEGDDYGFSLGKREVVLIDTKLFDAISTGLSGPNIKAQKSFNKSFLTIMDLLIKDKNYTFVGPKGEEQIEEALNIAKYVTFPVLSNKFLETTIIENLKTIGMDLDKSINNLKENARLFCEPSNVIREIVKIYLTQGKRFFLELPEEKFIQMGIGALKKKYSEKGLKEIPKAWEEKLVNDYMKNFQNKAINGTTLNERVGEDKDGIKKGIYMLEEAFKRERSKKIR